MRAHDRGIPFTPVAIVLDRYAGYNGYRGRPWGILENTPGDLETRDLFQHQLFPGSDHIHVPADPENPEKSYLRPTPFGEAFDVLLSHASGERLGDYRVILLVGDIEFDAAFVAALHQALRQGSLPDGLGGSILIGQDASKGGSAASIVDRLQQFRAIGKAMKDDLSPIHSTLVDEPDAVFHRIA